MSIKSPLFCKKCYSCISQENNMRHKYLLATLISLISCSLAAVSQAVVTKNNFNRLSAWDSGGNIYTAVAQNRKADYGEANNRILISKRSPGGTLLWTWKITSSAVTFNAAALKIDSSGNLVFLGSQVTSTGQQLLLWTATSSCTGVYAVTAGSASEIYEPTDLAIDSGICVPVGNYKSSSSAPSQGFVMNYNYGGAPFYYWYRKLFSPQTNTMFSSVAIDYSTFNIFVLGASNTTGSDQTTRLYKLDPATGTTLASASEYLGTSQYCSTAKVLLNTAGDVFVVSGIMPPTGTATTVVRRYTSACAQTWGTNTSNGLQPTDAKLDTAGNIGLSGVAWLSGVPQNNAFNVARYDKYLGVLMFQASGTVSGYPTGSATSIDFNSSNDFVLSGVVTDGTHTGFGLVAFNYWGGKITDWIYYVASASEAAEGCQSVMTAADTVYVTGSIKYSGKMEQGTIFFQTNYLPYWAWLTVVP